MQFKRYGVYFTPRPGIFAQAGASWLGWDIARGLTLPSPEPELTARPRKYGFHATMKPPFSLAKGETRDALQAAVEALCTGMAPVVLQRLEINRIGSFMAFTAQGETEPLGALASRCVRELDAFRAPPSEAELERRRQASLTPEQEANLRRWGYPHVMESFRFHMTLTGPVPRGDRERILPALSRHFANTLVEPFVIDSLTLVGEAQDGFFHEIERFALFGA
jgi:putative phosphonate metabolism protein